MADALINLVQLGGDGDKNESGAPSVDLLKNAEDSKAGAKNSAGVKGLPADATGASGNASATDNSSFENIFSQTKTAEKDSKMLKSIITQKDALQKLKPILGSAPNLEKTLEQEKEFRTKRKLRLVQMIFVIIFGASAVMVLYFYSQLSPNFHFLGANATTQLSEMNLNLQKQQTLLNKFRYLTAQVDLNDFSYQADRFFENVRGALDPANSSIEKNDYLAKAEESKKALPELLTQIRSAITSDFVAPTYRSEAEKVMTADEIEFAAQNDLRALLRQDRDALAKNSSNSEDLQNAKLIDNALKLVGDKNLVNAVQSISLDTFKKNLDDYETSGDAQQEKTLREMMGAILSATKSDLATITDVKSKRLEWSSVIQHVDVFGQPAHLDNGDNITYSGYEFDAATNKIILSGTSKTSSGKNFTLMSDVMASLEQSPYFQNVEMRSFSKSKDGNQGTEQGYLANFKIDLQLESTNQFSDKNAKISLQLEPQNSSGVQRVSQ